MGRWIDTFLETPAWHGKRPPWSLGKRIERGLGR